MDNEWVRHDSGDFSQRREDDLEREAERRERWEMEDPSFLPDPTKAPLEKDE